MHDAPTILVVDDDPGLVRLTERALRRDGYQTGSAGSAKEAMEWLRNQDADLLLLDLKLPDIEGRDFVDLMVSEGRSIPFIVITGQGDERVAVEMMKRGALDYIVKDANFLEFIPSVVRHGLAQIERDQRLEAAERRRRESEALYRNLVGCAAHRRIHLRSGRGNNSLQRSGCGTVGQAPELGKDRWCGCYGLEDPHGAPIIPDQGPVAQAMRDGRPIRDVGMIIERPDQSRRHVLAFSEPVKNGSGAINMLVDITESRELKNAECARDAALKANEAKTDFLATLSHELRNPLAPVLLLAGEGALDEDLPASVRADFDLIAKNIAVEARLIDDLLDATRITHGKVYADLQPVELHDVLRDALKTVEGKIRQKRQVLDLDFTAGCTTVMGDAVRLQQVLWNVLQNVVKFTPVEGRIQVKTEIDPNGHAVVVKVMDNGLGMTAAELNRAFESFGQGDHARSGGSQRFEGLGLGLAICRKLLHLHSGRISAASDGRGKGSTFTIEVPVLEMVAHASFDEPSIEPAHEAAGTAFPSEGFRILLVEDHEASRLTLAALLRRRGYHVAEAATVRESLELADERIDLVISDIGLPDGNGYDLMVELGTRIPGLVGIAMTGYGTDADVRRSMDAGFAAHLVKPVRIADLQAALAKAFAVRAAQAAVPA